MVDHGVEILTYMLRQRAGAMDRQEKSNGIKPIIVIAPIILSGAVLVQLITGTVIRRSWLAPITRADSPVLFWLAIAGEATFAAFLLFAILQLQRRD
jgi:hypothetical protein